MGLVISAILIAKKGDENSKAKDLLSADCTTNVGPMGSPPEPLSLSPEEIESLNRKLSDMRHSVNNHLTLLTTALELIRRKPDSIPRMLESMADQPQKIRDELARFSEDFERALKIER